MLHHRISVTRRDLKQRKERLAELVKAKFEREKEYRLRKFGERHSLLNIEVRFTFSGNPTLYLFLDVEREESDYEFRERTDIRYRTLKAGEVLVLERSRDSEVMVVEVFKCFDANSLYKRDEIAAVRVDAKIIDSQVVDGFHLFVCDENEITDLEGEKYKKDSRQDKNKKDNNKSSIWNRVKCWWRRLKYKKDTWCHKISGWFKQWIPDTWASVEVIPILHRLTVFQRDGEIREIIHALPWKSIGNSFTSKVGCV